jgi:hypothetical protein
MLAPWPLFEQSANTRPTSLCFAVSAEPMYGRDDGARCDDGLGLLGLELGLELGPGYDSKIISIECFAPLCAVAGRGRRAIQS